MKNRYFSTAIIAAALVCSIVAAKAIAQGYDGLIPEVQQKDASDEGFADESFGGILAPRSHDDYGRPISKDDPQGYPGLLPGVMPEEREPIDSSPNERPRREKGMSVRPGMANNPFAPDFPPRPKPLSLPELPKISYAPWSGEKTKILTVDDLKTIAKLSQHRIDFNHLPPEMEERLGLPPGTSSMLNSARMPRIDGMTPFEFAVKRSIDSVMQVVEGKSGDELQRAAQLAYDRLSQLASGYRTLNSVPASIYTRLGAGDAYIEDQQEGYANSLARLQEALDALKELK